MESSNKRSQEVVTARGNVFLITIGWISAIISLFMFPLIFGVGGVVMGILSSKSGSRSGVALIAASIILMAIGLMFSGVILNYTRHYLGI